MNVELECYPINDWSKRSAIKTISNEDQLLETIDILYEELRRYQSNNITVAVTNANLNEGLSAECLDVLQNELLRRYLPEQIISCRSSSFFGFILNHTIVIEIENEKD